MWFLNGIFNVMSGGDVTNMVKLARLLASSEELWCIMINNFVDFWGVGLIFL